MSFRPFTHFIASSIRLIPELVAAPLSRVGCCVVLTMATAIPLQAGTKDRPLVSTGRVQPKPTPARSVKPAPANFISKTGYLAIIGPAGISTKPVAGPRVRQAPMLPTPKVVSADSAAAAKSSDSQALAQHQPSEPSAFSPDEPPMLLPAEKASQVAKAEEKIEPKENVLVPASRGEMELKDAVIYFETPVGSHGSQVALPVLVPHSSPAAATQPASRATYHEEK